MTWEALLALLRAIGGPEGVRAGKHAQAAGVSPADLSEVWAPTKPAIVVQFYNRCADELRTFDAEGERGWHS